MFSTTLCPDQAVILEMAWMHQALLVVDIVGSKNLVEIMVFGWLCVQNRVKSMLLSLAWFHQGHCARAEKIKHLEKNLNARASGPHTPQHSIA
uniref:KH-like RNA-binding domain-containing protein n=1 Tax=Theropithecus gelada TaxID=9565 RepID=A0A8D2FRI3_THEGE